MNLFYLQTGRGKGLLEGILAVKICDALVEQVFIVHANARRWGESNKGKGRRRREWRGGTQKWGTQNGELKKLAIHPLVSPPPSLPHPPHPPLPPSPSCAVQSRVSLCRAHNCRHSTFLPRLRHARHTALRFLQHHLHPTDSPPPSSSSAPRARHGHQQTRLLFILASCKHG